METAGGINDFRLGARFDAWRIKETRIGLTTS